MNSRVLGTGLGLAMLGLALLGPAYGCCPAPRQGKPVVNADQSVIMIWDAANKTQHFIRRASFKSEGADFGFLIPTPSQPELNESGNEAFAYLEKVTAPAVRKVALPRSPFPAGGMGGMKKGEVRVLEEKLVAGFNAVVLEADSATALTQWLKEHEYAYSPEIEAWAKPYVDEKWKITALKVAKETPSKPGEKSSVTASALRMTFQTERPLFPYREPDSTKSAQSLGAKRRLLRIYFLAEAKYEGELTAKSRWTGKVAWSGKITPEQRKETLSLLKLPETTGPASWWLTEFEDAWPYKVAPADLYFTKSKKQTPLRRPVSIEYVSSPAPQPEPPKLTAGH